MKLPTIKRILREDLSDAPNWVNNLINPMNTFMEMVYQALNSNITLTENIASFIQEVTYTTGSSYPSGQADQSFMNTLKTRPIGVQLLQVFDRQTYEAPPGPVYIPWVANSVNQIVLNTITGLEADKTYTIRLLIF